MASEGNGKIGILIGQLSQVGGSGIAKKEPPYYHISRVKPFYKLNDDHIFFADKRHS